MSDFRITIRDGKTKFRPGATVEGSASWNLSTAPQSVEIRLKWFTRGKGTCDANIVETTLIAAPAAMGDAPFRFQLPDAPHSFSGQLIALVWAVEIVAQSGKKRDGAAVEFVLSPFEAPVTLPKIDRPLSPLEEKWKKRAERLTGRSSDCTPTRR